MKKRVDLLSWAIGLSLSTLAVHCAAQSTVSRAGSDIVLEEILERLVHAGDPMQNKTSALLALVDAEAGANRISAATADELRSTARKIGSPINGDPRTLIASTHLPAEDVVRRAVHELESEAIATQVKRDALIAQARVETRKRTRELAFSAAKAAEIEPLIDLLTRLESEAQTYSTPDQSSAAIETFKPCRAFLRMVSSFLTARDRHDATTAKSALLEMHGFLNVTSISFDDIHMLSKRMMAPLDAAAENARHAVEAALAERKSSGEVSEALKRFEETTAYRDAIQRAVYVGPAVSTYRKMAAIEDALGMPGEPWVTQRIAEVRQALQAIAWPIAPRYARANDLLDEWEREFAKAATKDAAGQHEKLAAKIGAIRQPAGIDALVRELQASTSENNKERSDEGVETGVAALNSLLNQLASLAIDWKAGDFRSLNKQSQAGDVEDPNLAREMGRLRRRAARQTLSQILRAPELDQPPLAEQPLEIALQAFLENLKNKKDWQRTLGLLQSRTVRNEAGVLLARHKEAASSIRAFVAGQNFELAEQWTDAAAAYRVVLGNAAEFSPVTEAAERLKAIKKEHLVSQQ